MAAKHTKREAVPPIVTLFRDGNGDIHHARCGTRIAFHGARGGGIEFDFYCVACPAHITIPRAAFDRIPAAAAPAPRHAEPVAPGGVLVHAATPSARSAAQAAWRRERAMVAS
jgi:hypothetical protein